MIYTSPRSNKQKHETKKIKERLRKWRKRIRRPTPREGKSLGDNSPASTKGELQWGGGRRARANNLWTPISGADIDLCNLGGRLCRRGPRGRLIRGPDPGAEAAPKRPQVIVSSNPGSNSPPKFKVLSRPLTDGAPGSRACPPHVHVMWGVLLQKWGFLRREDRRVLWEFGGFDFDWFEDVKSVLVSGKCFCWLCWCLVMFDWLKIVWLKKVEKLLYCY